MNSKSMHIDHSSNPGVTEIEARSNSILAILANLDNAGFGRSGLAKAQDY